MDITHLPEDIYNLFNRGESCDMGAFGEAVAASARRAFIGHDRKGKLGLSMMGKCPRSLWYHVHDFEPEEFKPNVRMKFYFGDAIEDIVLHFAEAAGHKVEMKQHEVEVAGIKGHIDAIVDGMLVDVKSASTYSFRKFREGKLRQDDPFGYISQLSSYLYACQDMEQLKVKDKAAFIVVDKQHGHIHVDIHDMTEDLKTIESQIERVRNAANADSPPPRPYQTVMDRSGNEKLPLNCSYCNHKWNCYPGLRGFYSQRGPVFYSVVNREPDMKEIRR